MSHDVRRHIGTMTALWPWHSSLGYVREGCPPRAPPCGPFLHIGEPRLPPAIVNKSLNCAMSFWGEMPSALDELVRQPRCTNLLVGVAMVVVGGHVCCWPIQSCASSMRNPPLSPTPDSLTRAHTFRCVLFKSFPTCKRLCSRAPSSAGPSLV